VSRPSISVAMATYNGARFLPEQLASIAAQTLLPAELVVTDDGSSDNTLAIVRAFAETAPFPVRIHRNPVNLGFRGNFMHAIGLCSSELIALCDQDDVWEPHKLACVIEPFADADVLLSYHEAWLIDEGGARLGQAGIYPLLARNPPSSANAMRNPYGFAMTVHRRLFDFSDLWAQSVDNLHADQHMAHDQWLFFLASALGTVAYIDQPLAGYRQHGGNTYGLDRADHGWRGQLNHWINVRARDFAPLTVAATRRADILEQITQRLDAPADRIWRERARVAVAHYRAFADHARLRARVYDGATIPARAMAWAAMLRRGAYGNSSRWTFGHKAALIDAGCLVAPHALSALTRRNHTATGSARE
jgi:hypothetical protein